jgi:hypothetical protein
VLQCQLLSHTRQQVALIWHLRWETVQFACAVSVSAITRLIFLGIAQLVPQPPHQRQQRGNINCSHTPESTCSLRIDTCLVAVCRCVVACVLQGCGC